MRAGRGLAVSEAAVVHVAFADDAEAGVEFRNVVGALQDAVAATDALIVEMADDAGQRIFFVRENRTAVKTCRIGAVVTRGGDRLREGLARVRAGDEPDIAPRFVFVETVE